MVVGIAHLERDPARPERIGSLHERGEQHRAVALGVVAGADTDGGDVGFERDPPEARIAHDLALLTQHDVRRLRFCDSSLAYAFFGHGDEKTWRSIACTAAMSS